MHIFQCTSITLVSQGHKDFDHNDNNFIYSKAIRLTGKKINIWKLQLKVVKTQIFTYWLGNLEIFSFIFHFPVLFLMHRSLLWLYNHISRNSDSHRWYQRYLPSNYKSFSILISACFSEEIKVLHKLIWDLKFSRIWGKKWAPMNTTAGAYFSTIA